MGRYEKNRREGKTPMRRAGINTVGTLAEATPDAVAACAAHGGLASYEFVGSGDNRSMCKDGRQCYYHGEGGTVCSDQCPANTTWNNNSGECMPNICTPKNCSEAGASCGPASDGCGGTLDCSSCPAGEKCVAGKCGSAAGSWPGGPPGSSLPGIPGGLDVITTGVVAEAKAKCLADGKNIYNDKTGACTPKSGAEGPAKEEPSNAGLYAVGGLVLAGIVWAATRPAKGKRR